MSTRRFIRKKKKPNELKENVNIVKKKFEIRKSKIKYGKGKYCSVECCDEHKKEIYKGEGAPIYGKEMSEETKEKQKRNKERQWFKNGRRIGETK